MPGYPHPIEGSNVGDGSPLVLGTEDIVADLHTPCDPTVTVHVLDWDGDGQQEMVCSGNDIFSYKFVDSLPDGAPIVDRGMRWGLMSRYPQRNSINDGLTGYIVTAADFDGDGNIEAILGSRYYSKEPMVAVSLADGAPTSRTAGRPIRVVESDNVKWTRGSAAAIDWDGDGTVDLLMLELVSTASQHVDPATGVCPEDQPDRYNKDGSWIGNLRKFVLHLYRNTSSDGSIEFTHIGVADVDLPAHTMWISVVDPNDPSAGLLLLTYYGRLCYLPLVETGDTPKFGAVSELVTLHQYAFNRSTNLCMSINVADPFESGRYDLFAGDHAQSPSWCRYHGRDDQGRPVYGNPVRIKQRNPHIGNSFFSVPTVGDLRGTGVPDLLLGGVEGYIYWYKTLSTNPLRFAPPERLRNGTTEIRRLSRANPSAGHHWGGSQTHYDGDIGGYSNPVLIDWDGDGRLDLVVSDMLALYDWYPNWGSKSEPEFGPPQRLHVTDGESLRGPWRQQAGIGFLTGGNLPDIVIQDLDLDLAVHRRFGHDDLSALLPGEKLRFEDGETIKTHGVYTSEGGDGRGRTKINVVDWDSDGLLDLLIGVGPQHGSPYRGSYVLFAKNVGTRENPIFRRPDVLLWDADGAPLEFWRHGVHMAPVDWDGDGRYELIAGADQGRVWYWKPEHFGQPAGGKHTAPLRETGEEGLGRDSE
jgi:hypothetical protein